VLDVSVPACTNGVWASSAACECGAGEQTVDHVVLHCQIYRHPYGVDGLTVLDDETRDNPMAAQHMPRDLMLHIPVG